ncbi:hypothetical protein BASA50_007236 [Batrachochytrium salamandrivorans]|uniref:Uncharacterized protein n=1 Tax=Batrachochytrium salamandrivorans TaxID=1357716 RepID=A0ABQ8F8S9_9FUNG|nr:hypothetical protein BASA50_007236 [Batrachochytrium salamandrivorans]
MKPRNFFRVPSNFSGSEAFGSFEPEDSSFSEFPKIARLTKSRASWLSTFRLSFSIREISGVHSEFQSSEIVLNVIFGSFRIGFFEVQE